MSRVILYIACSLDGYIAGKDGDISWLSPFEGGDEDYGYKDLYNRLGAIIMGGNTYRQVLTFGSWPYSGVDCYVVTRQPLVDKPSESVQAYAGDMRALVDHLKREYEKDIWLVGGSQLIAPFVAERLIDEYIISILPVLLGEGIPLFQSPGAQASLKFIKVLSYPSGILQVHYESAP